MSRHEGCSPYALSVGILIGFFIGRQETCPEPAEEAAWQIGSAEWEGFQQPLFPPPSPVHYRVLLSVIAEQLQAVDRAEEKTLGVLQNEIREALPDGDYGQCIADRLGRRLGLITSVDDLVDLVDHMNLLLKPPEEDSSSAHGRERPMYLRPNSVFGVFLRRIRIACNGANFSRLALLLEDIVRYTDRLRADMVNVSEVDVADDLMRDIESPRFPWTIGRKSFGLGGRPADAAGVGEGVHIRAFLQRQSLEAALSKPNQSWVSNRDLGGDSGGAPAERYSGACFPRSVTAWQIQRRLQDKVMRMESGRTSQVPFEAIEDEVQAALGAHSDVPKAHFVRMMNCMHHRELQGSLDSLHRFFDYAVRRGGPSISTADGIVDIVKGAQGGSGRHRPQYASLALARLHLEFGHLELASLAVGETIRVAQQSGDKVCVAYAMSWLHQVMAAQGHPRAGDVLRRCAAQAADLRLDNLAHSAALLLAREAAAAKNGSTPFAASCSPTRVWECLAAAASGDVRGLLESEAAAGSGGGKSGGAYFHSLAAPGGGRGGRPVSGREGGTGGEVAGARTCKQLLVEAGAFERYGCPEMAATCARSILEVHREFASVADIELASAHVMAVMLRGKRVPGLEPPRATETSTPSDGDTERDVPSSASAVPECVFEAALRVALRQHTEYPHPVSNVWAAGVMGLLHEWMVNRGELAAAEGLGMSLRACCPLSQGVEGFIEAHLQRVRLLRAQGRYSEAVDAASALAKLSDSRGLAPQYARLLLELSQTRLDAEPASPVGALPHALRCLAVCESFSLDEVHASAMTHLAEVHLRMGSTRRARTLMRACLGQLLVNSPVQTQGEAWLAMAKCEIAESSLGPVGMGDTSSGEEVPAGGRGSKGDAEAGTTGTAGLLRRAVLHLDRAVELLKQCHHFSGLRECWYLKARAWGELVTEGGGERARSERNSAAQAFLAVSEAGVRALAVTSPGLKIGPAEIERYMVEAMKSVPWTSP